MKTLIIRSCLIWASSLLAAHFVQAQSRPPSPIDQEDCAWVGVSQSAPEPAALLPGAVRVPGSALLTLKSPELREARGRSDKEQRIQLTADLESGAAVPTADVTVGNAPGSPVRIAWHPPPAHAPGLRLAGLEGLYVLVFRSDPLRRYELSVAGTEIRMPAASHEAVLRRIASWRTCAVAGLGQARPDLQPAAWERVTISQHRVPRAAGNRVAVRVRGADGRAVAKAHVTFARGNHMACDAKTDDEGVAACRLVDIHGHAGHEDEDARAPTIVTFAGVVTADHILLPTTSVGDGGRHGRR